MISPGKRGYLPRCSSCFPPFNTQLLYKRGRWACVKVWTLLLGLPEPRNETVTAPLADAGPTGGREGGRAKPKTSAVPSPPSLPPRGSREGSGAGSCYQERQIQGGLIWTHLAANCGASGADWPWARLSPWQGRRYSCVRWLCVREKRVPTKEGGSCGDQIYDSVGVFLAKDGTNNFSFLWQYTEWEETQFYAKKICWRDLVWTSKTMCFG